MTLEPMENHWIPLCFLQSLRDGMPYGLPRTLRVLGNLTVNRKRWKTIKFPYVFTCQIKMNTGQIESSAGLLGRQNEEIESYG